MHLTTYSWVRLQNPHAQKIQPKILKGKWTAEKREPGADKRPSIDIEFHFIVYYEGNPGLKKSYLVQKANEKILRETKFSSSDLIQSIETTVLF